MRHGSIRSPFKVLAGLVLGIAVLAGVARAAMTSADLDAMLAAEWKKAGVEPAGVADDSAFIRRLSLDVRGVIPSVEETVAFLSDKSPDKRAKLVDAYLTSPERGENWAVYWDKVLVGNLEQPENKVVATRLKSSWRDWVTEQFNKNAPYDKFMREVVSADGDIVNDPETMPLARWRQAPESMAGTMSRAFLGWQIQCAQCHDHKTNKDLTQEKFWEFAAFFGNTRVVPVRKDGNKGYETIRVEDQGFKWEVDVPQSDPKKKVTPHYLDGTAATQEVVDGDGKVLSQAQRRQKLRELNEIRKKNRPKDGEQPDPETMMKAMNEAPVVRDTRRDQLAAMILKHDQRQFAANLVNRAWARAMGRGFIHPVDEWRTDVEPVMPAVLEKLTDEFIASGYNVRLLERTIYGTKAYQHASMPTATGKTRAELFPHAIVRPLGPEQMLDSFVIATNAADVANTQGSAEQKARLRETYTSQFIYTFDNDEMEWTNAFESSLPRSLFLLNDSVVNKAVSASKGSMLSRILGKTKDPAEVADYMYLAALSRRPDAEEKKAFVDAVSRAKTDDEKKKIAEDAFWALLNSTEFLTNH